MEQRLVIEGPEGSLRLFPGVVEGPRQLAAWRPVRGDGAEPRGRGAILPGFDLDLRILDVREWMMVEVDLASGKADADRVTGLAVRDPFPGSSPEDALVDDGDGFKARRRALADADRSNGPGSVA